MDSNDAEETWKILEYAIHDMYNHNASDINFEELYRFVCSSYTQAPLILFSS